MIRKGLLKSALVIVSALLMVSVVCPLSSATVTDGILEQLNELKEVIGEVVDEYPLVLTWNTRQQENALYNKIDAVMMMVEEGNYMGAIKKLEKDISPKLMEAPDFNPQTAKSWLSVDMFFDPELQPVVEEFAGMCQGMINDILIALNRLING